MYREASAAADKTEQILLNQYRSALVAYTDVVTAQVAALNARRTLVQVQLNRQLAAVSLIQALGGGWHAGWMEGEAQPGQPAASPASPASAARP